MLNVFSRKQPEKYDRAGIQKLILTELPRIRRFAFALTQDQHDTDDLLQALVEKLLQQSIPVDVKPVPWILKVAKNLWIDELRKRKTRGTQFEIQEDATASAEDVAKQHENTAQMARVMSAIKQLPEGQRVVLSLVMSAEMSYADVAEVLDIPIGTVMSRLARARETLSKMMRDE